VKKWLGLVSLVAVCAACGGGDNPAPPAGEAAALAPAATEAANVPAATAPVAEAAAPPRPAAPPAPRFRDVTIPAGTTLRLDLASSIGSDSSRVEDSVRATLRQAVAVDGQPVLPAGTELVGIVTDVDDAGRVKGRAHIAYRFNTLRHDGERYDITTAPISHQAEATKGEDATKIAIGAGAGAAIGALLGGGDGAAKGAAIGGASGTGVVLATKGKEVRLGPGANVTTQLTAPLTVRVKL
jgi:hypothetical protein